MGNIGKNEKEEIMKTLSFFVKENFELLFEGARRVYDIEDEIGKEIEEAEVTINPKDDYTGNRIQVNGTRINGWDGVKIYGGYSKNEEWKDSYHIRKDRWKIIPTANLIQSIRDLMVLVKYSKKQIKVSSEVKELLKELLIEGSN